jgi:hypothetical protein
MIEIEDRDIVWVLGTAYGLAVRDSAERTLPEDEALDRLLYLSACLQDDVKLASMLDRLWYERLAKGCHVCGGTDGEHDWEVHKAEMRATEDPSDREQAWYEQTPEEDDEVDG